MRSAALTRSRLNGLGLYFPKLGSIVLAISLVFLADVNSPPLNFPAAESQVCMEPKLLLATSIAMGDLQEFPEQTKKNACRLPKLDHIYIPHNVCSGVSTATYARGKPFPVARHERHWFLCPARGCGRRVAILYSGALFACRQCHQLAYRSQRENCMDRATRRADRIRDKLGWPGGILEGSKPKGMHWRTYHRLCNEHDAFIDTAMAGFIDRFGLQTAQELFPK